MPWPATAAIPAAASSIGTLNLNGGTLTTHSVGLNVNTFNFIPQSLWGTGVFNFNGGVLQASANNPSQGTFMGGLSAAYVQSGGANISTNYPLDTISQALVHDPSVTITDGGLTKTGSGTLTLSGTNTFNGPTTVSSGTLTIANALALQNSTVNSSGGGAISISAVQRHVRRPDGQRQPDRSQRHAEHRQQRGKHDL